MPYVIARRLAAAALIVGATSLAHRSPASDREAPRSILPDGAPRDPDVDPLRVVRALPSGAATPNAEIRVTFDRPVAGSLDVSVDPKTVLTFAPAVTGKVEWRDPVTIVFRPTVPMLAGTTYTVTVATTFRAMDGARLERPYTFSFRVNGAMLIGGDPVSADMHPTLLLPNAKFNLVWSSPVDADKVAGASYIQLSAACPGDKVVRLRSLGVRAISDSDSYRVRDAGGYRRDRAADSLRRVVSLAPATPLPLDCSATLIAPLEMDQIAVGNMSEWEFSTYGPLTLESAKCAGGVSNCPTGPITVRFSTPVRGSAVRHKVSLIPSVPFTMADTSEESTTWQLDAPLRPRTTYAVVVDTSLRDTFGQRLTGNPAAGFATSGYVPSVSYPYGRLLVEREGFGTLAVRHVNVDTLVVTAALVPDSLESSFLRNSVWSWATLWQRVAPRAITVRVPTHAGIDKPTVTGVKLPAIVGSANRRGLIAVRIAGPANVKLEDDVPNIALVQITNLAVHAKVGATSAVVWVTRVNDGRAVPGAAVTVRDQQGRTIASGRTDAGGVANFPALVRVRATAVNNDDDDEGGGQSVDGFVEASLGDDRALVGVSQYDPDLSPWQFGVYPAWGATRLPLAGAVFTERGIYRPGEPLYAKAIVRRGALGALGSPAAGDSVRWIFKDREEGVLKDTVVRLSAFGTSSRMITLPRSLALGYYRIELQYRWQGTWTTIDQTGYRVAEYRPPEFLVDVTGPKAPMFPGDSLRASVEARYLFGAPMGRAAFEWSMQRAVISPWEIDIPGLGDGDWYVGETGWWWEEDEGSREVETVTSGVDTLDASGRRQLRLAVPATTKGRGARVTFTASVTDVNRQAVASQTTVIVHPAEFYIAAKPVGDSYFWRAGQAQSVQLITVRPSGDHVTGIAVRGTIVRREWHQVHRERDGAAEVVGEWVSDTVARCTVTTAVEPRRCDFTPKDGGSYIVTFVATDARGREARTSLYRWAEGSDWVPWEDESRFRMDVIADKSRYSVGDTATVMLASPFTGAEAWVTVEREGVIEQRRLSLNSGSTLVKLPITEAYVPNAYVSVIVVRGRSAPPGTLDDPGRPTMRVGYAQLKVTPEVKRLAVKVQPLAAEYLPGDSARIRLTVADSRGVPRRAEVTLWAVDEGVLSLTGYKTPDPIDMLYQPRGLGLRLASNLVSVAPQIPEGEKGRRAPGGGGGAAGADVLRSRFKTTAFFLGSVITDAKGQAIASAKLPDNLTTFRVMAVAATQSDRFGSGEAKLLVTRAVVARPALPRFLRPGDEFTAGTVVNRRTGAASPVTVQATSSGVELRGDAQQSATLEAGRGAEVRFPFRAPTTNAGDTGDTATFRFTATSGSDVDAVQSRLPFRPDYHPRSYTASGVLHDTATVELILPKGIDAARSRVEVSLGGSVLALVRGAYRQLRVYPWYCTEQVTSAGRPLLALYRASKAPGASETAVAPASAKTDLQLAVRMLSERQRSDGGIGYWSAEHWTSPWLSAYAGLFLLDARDAGIAVDDSVLSRLGAYLRRSQTASPNAGSPIYYWYSNTALLLSERVAIADYLSRTGKPDVAGENKLLAQLAQMRWEDRARLAQVVARRGAKREAAGILAPIWAGVQVVGRRAVLPDSARLDSIFYFQSTVRPAARLLMATLAVAPTHPLVGPLVENVIQQGRATSVWNTQDWAMAVEALAMFERTQLAATTGTIRARAGNRVLLEGAVGRATAPDSTIALTGLLGNAPGDAKSLRLSLDMSGAPNGVAYYYVTVREVPEQRPVKPDDHGVVVERWYERYDTRAPTTSVAEGELVRVRLRITIPEDREFLVLDDALPAGLEAVDLSLRTAALMPGPGSAQSGRTQAQQEREEAESNDIRWGYGSWDSGWWSPFDYRELRDDRVVYFATRLWKGTYSATYVARATTPGTFIRPPTHAEEMYNPAVFGRSDGGVFTVTKKKP